MYLMVCNSSKIAHFLEVDEIKYMIDGCEFIYQVVFGLSCLQLMVALVTLKQSVSSLRYRVL